jgi:diguanylate cyclase (GGDEF)-like protein/PAS domain S-box-containing protein
MHPRLRRQLAALGSDLPPEFRQLIAAVDATYRENEAERAELEESVNSLTALLHRAQTRAGRGVESRKERRAKAARAQKRLGRLLEKSRLAVFELTPQLVVRKANPAAAKLAGVGQQDLPGKKIFDVLVPVGAPEVPEKWARRLGRGEPVARTLACSARDGRALACDWVLLPRQRKDGSVFRITAVLRDQTPVVEKHDEVRDREERLSLALSGASDVLWDWDLPGNRLHLSPRWRDLLGLPAVSSGTPADWLDRVHPEDATPLRAALASHFEGRTDSFENEHRVRHADGDWRWVLVRGTARRDEKGAAVRAAGLMSDITRHRTLVERMAHDARHDGLTGLPNRTLFLDLLRHSFYRTRRHEDYRFAVLFIDIDRFKMVNDAFGHEAGDQLLHQIGRRLESCLREGDTLARHGGDEFTMWLDDVRGSADAVRVADRVHEVMREPFDLGEGQRVQSSASIGVAVGSSQYQKAEDVLRDADVAMYRAKALGKARTAVFQRDVAEGAPAYLQLESDLRNALVRNELLVHYMPIVDVMTGKVRAVEALARWQHPRLGLVPPSKFIVLAQETGLIIAIDQWVLQTASRQLHDWRLEIATANRLSISVNFSRNLLEQADVGAQTERVLRESHLVPGDLNMDINESVLAPDNGIDTLADLHQRGLKLHMDDFGTGQGWLRHLHKIEVDTIKIDHSFLAGGADRDRQVLTRIVQIARDLGKSVIAEGVETKEQARLVREVGCSFAQGFFFSPPLDPAKTRTLLQGGVLDVV